MEREVQIDRVAAQGDGVAMTPDGPVFVPLTLPGERVRIRGGQGGMPDIIERLTDSPARVAPVSPQYGSCGGCSLQHWAAGPYLEWKADLVREVLRKQSIIAEVEPTFAVSPGTRRRLALHARRDHDGRVRLGFKARKSWTVVSIDRCPIADPRIEQALPELRLLSSCFLGHPKSAPTLHVTVTDDGLDVDVTGVETRSGGLSADERAVAIDAARRMGLVRLSLAGEVLMFDRQPHVTFGRARVPLPPGGFLQAVPQAEAAMVKRVIDAASGARRVADLFCGAGTFTLPLAERASMTAADTGAAAVEALRRGHATTPGLKPVATQVRDLFRRPLTSHELKGHDLVVLDPPRAGAMDQVAQIADARPPVVAYVSCNPTTFARDARVLVDKGYRLDPVLPIDQFLWSAHVELVAVFRR